MKKFSLVALAGIALTVAGTLEAGGNHDYKGGYHDYKGGKAGFEFALIGDTPYGVLPGVEYQPFDRVVSDINADRKIKWVMHAGDIKGGSTPCSDEMFNDRLTRYNAFSKPVILTLGDNEWTDCHRIAAGEYQPLERLAKLREIFYAEPGKVTIGQQSMMVQTQATNLEYANYPENVWWQRRGVMFAAIHVVGSRNGLAPFADGSAAVRTEADDAEVAERIEAAVGMLNTVFDRAVDSNSPGVFIMIHANPAMERNQMGAEGREGFVEFLTALENRVKAYGKPVVLAHGDSHYFRIDQPPIMNERFLKNFTRVETYGSGNVHWIRVNVDPRSEQVFSFEQEIVEAN